MSTSRLPTSQSRQADRYYTTGALLVVGSALLFSAKAVFIKLAYRYGIDTVTLMTLRMLFSVPVYVVVAYISIRGGGGTRMDGTTLLQIGLLGLLGYYLASFLDLSGLQYITANLERLILYIYPSLVVVLSAIVLRRPMQLGELLCLLGAYAGIALVFAIDLNIYTEHTVNIVGNIELPAVLWGGILVFGSALSFACYLVGSEHVMRRLSATLFTSLAMMSSTLAISVHFLLTQPFENLLNQPAALYALAFAVAILSTVLPSYMMAAGIQRISAARASIFGSVGPVSTMVMGYLLLDETITAAHIAGLVIVVLSCLALGRMRR